MSASCNRVHVKDGHLESVFVKLDQKPSIEQVEAAFARLQRRTAKAQAALCTRTTQSLFDRKKTVHNHDLTATQAKA